MRNAAKHPWIRKQAPPPVFIMGDMIGEGDSSLILDILPPELSDVAFKQIIAEVDWNVMYHRGKSPCQ